IQWSHFTTSYEYIVYAGWFPCNMNDQVICMCYNRICHEWTMIDEKIEDTLDEDVEPSHPEMAEISHRETTVSNTTWKENSPTIENLVRVGFFNVGIDNSVTCFYCNGLLHKWSPNDNPLIEHAR
ncbi:unnamed protein product, partial [Rotaria sp. Silwood1]